MLRRPLLTPKPPRLVSPVKPPTASEERAPNTWVKSLGKTSQSPSQAENFAIATVRTMLQLSKIIPPGAASAEDELIYFKMNYLNVLSTQKLTFSIIKK